MPWFVNVIKGRLIGRQQAPIRLPDGIRQEHKIQQLTDSTEAKREEHHHAITHLPEIHALHTTNANKREAPEQVAQG